MTYPALWQKCLGQLQAALPAQQFNTWIKPLQATLQGQRLCLLAPNRFVLEWVNGHFVEKIHQAVSDCSGGAKIDVALVIGNHSAAKEDTTKDAARPVPQAKPMKSSLNPFFTFKTHIEGKSNQLARAAAGQVADNPATAYNPLFIYGSVGLGKTHLMHAVGNSILARNPAARIVYVHAERFVADMVRALRNNTINEFKSFYRSLDALLIDDVQFFAGKERSQEEFFYTFNALTESQRQIVITADRFPREFVDVEERLVSRFGSGLIVCIEPPELETRVAILITKAKQQGIDLSEQIAFFIAKRVRSNVRELEGTLRRVIAGAAFTGQPLTVELAAESLKDLLAFQERQVTINNIQKTVAAYYKIRVSDLHSKSRSRQVARPRQIAMAIAKELTNHSLPEIGDAFGGRDHTTVLHACRKVDSLMSCDVRIKEDYNNLTRSLTL